MSQGKIVETMQNKNGFVTNGAEISGFVPSKRSPNIRVSSVPVRAGSRRRKQRPEEWWVTLKGKAHLCFYRDDSWFEGNLVTVDNETEHHYECYGLHGKLSQGKNPRDADSYDIELMDPSDRSRRTIHNVAISRFGTYQCCLESSNLHFKTKEYTVGARADLVIKEYFSHRLMGHNCYVCIGPMEISYKMNIREEMCTSPPQYIF